MASTGVVKFVKKCKAFAVDNKIVEGLHRRLTRRFYPLYSFEKAEANCPGGGEDHSTATGKAKWSAWQRKRKTGSKTKGQRKGCLADRHMTDTIRWFKKFNVPMRAFCDKAAGKKFARANQSALSKECYLYLMGHARSDMAVKIWNTMRINNFTPSDTQVRVGVKEWGLATAVDMTAKDAHGNDVVIELKTGYTNYIHKHTAQPMRYISGNVSDCPANQHQLQLFVTTELFKRSKPHQGNVKSVIFHLTDTGVSLLHLKPWVTANAKIILREAAKP
jgi:hypothetical protein